MKQLPFGRPLLGPEEKNAVMQVLGGDILVHGPKAKEFELAFAQYTQAKNAISVGSCTAALHLSYFYLGLGAGDEVIVPAQTHNATAHTVELVGAKPVFVDCELETGNIDLDQIESAITPRTKALSLVHFLGMPVNMRRFMEIAHKHKLFVVEDCALALGSYFDGKHAGLWGDVGCFSFYPAKHMTTSEGGMLITQNDEIAKRVTRQKAFGVDRTASERSVPGVYDVTMLGFNYRMSEIESVLGIEQLKRMDGFLKQRKQNYEILEAQLRQCDELRLLKSSHGPYKSSYYCLSILLEPKVAPKRFEIVEKLKARGIGTSVYYPRPVPHFTYYKQKYGYTEDTFPNASRISYSSIALPVGPHLTPEDMGTIADGVKAALAEVK